MVDGAAVEAGFDPLTLPPDRFFNWLWRLFTKNMDEKQLAKFELEIYRPIPGIQAGRDSGPWSDDEMGAAFLGAMSGQRTR